MLQMPSNFIPGQCANIFLYASTSFEKTVWCLPDPNPPTINHHHGATGSQLLYYLGGSLNTHMERMCIHFGMVWDSEEQKTSTLLNTKGTGSCNMAVKWKKHNIYNDDQLISFEIASLSLSSSSFSFFLPTSNPPIVLSSLCAIYAFFAGNSATIW